MSRAIFLIGFMGSGKSTVGRLVAEGLGWACVDTDERVERRESRPIEEIFSDLGEGYFRRVEWEVLQDLECRSPCVVATGGGLFLGAAPRRWMKARGLTVWLDADLPSCIERAGSGGRRPLWQPQDPVLFRAFFEKRRAAYALADWRVDARGPAKAVASALLERLGRGPGAGNPPT